MSFIKQWVFSICTTLLISVVFSFLSPKGSMGKFYKIIISIFIFASFIFPLTEFSFNDFKIDYNFESYAQADLVITYENEIKTLISSELVKNGIDNAQINVNADVNDNVIEINNITVCIDIDHNPDDVKNLIYDNLGLVCEVKSVEFEQR